MMMMVVIVMMTMIMMMIMMMILLSSAAPPRPPCLFGLYDSGPSSPADAEDQDNLLGNYDNSQN